jgi:hypothetical protein
LGRHETILPLLHTSTERKTNGELDLIMAEFAGTLFCSLLFKTSVFSILVRPPIICSTFLSPKQFTLFHSFF